MSGKARPRRGRPVLGGARNPVKDSGGKKPFGERPCGCAAGGQRCADEGRLWGILEAALARWQASGAGPGDGDFLALYGPVLDARANYHAHFGGRYDAARDALLRQHEGDLFTDTFCVTYPPAKAWGL